MPDRQAIADGVGLEPTVDDQVITGQAAGRGRDRDKKAEISGNRPVCCRTAQSVAAGHRCSGAAALKYL
jgi:hypothetical protein